MKKGFKGILCLPVAPFARDGAEAVVVDLIQKSRT